jgi:hypothetical protein
MIMHYYRWNDPTFTNAPILFDFHCMKPPNLLLLGSIGKINCPTIPFFYNLHNHLSTSLHFPSIVYHFFYC